MESWWFNIWNGSERPKKASALTARETVAPQLQENHGPSLEYVYASSFVSFIGSDLWGLAIWTLGSASTLPRICSSIAGAQEMLLTILRTMQWTDPPPNIFTGSLVSAHTSDLSRVCYFHTAHSSVTCESSCGKLRPTARARRREGRPRSFWKASDQSLGMHLAIFKSLNYPKWKTWNLLEGHRLVIISRGY